jgi:hypothetical protein
MVRRKGPDAGEGRAALSREEFFTGYCQRSGITEEWARAHGFEAAPCACGEDCCSGWQMLTRVSRKGPLDVH